MRSNNVWTLLPYNIFEFTLLAEFMAADLGVALGTYHHHAVSMHLYANNLDEAAVRSYLDRAVEMGPFWSDLAGVLVAAAVRNAGLADSVEAVLDVLGPPFDTMVQRDLGTLVAIDKVTRPRTAKLASWRCGGAFPRCPTGPGDDSAESSKGPSSPPWPGGSPCSMRKSGDARCRPD